MINLNRQTLLWVFAIVLIVIKELLTLSNTTYPSLMLGSRIMIIAVDFCSGIIISVILTLLFNTIIAIIPYGESTFKSRFVNGMPIVLIIIEILLICFIN
jgi:hypothetical protein